MAKNQYLINTGVLQDITVEEISDMIHSDHTQIDKKLERLRKANIYRLKPSDKNTLILETSNEVQMLLKVVNGSIKLGWRSIDWLPHLHWDTPSEIIVKYPVASQENHNLIEIKYYFNDRDNYIYVKYKCIEEMTTFFNNLVSAGKLVSSINRGMGTKYTAITHHMTGGFH